MAIGQYEKLIAMYLKTLKAPVSKRQEHLDFTAASDAIEAEVAKIKANPRLGLIEAEGIFNQGAIIRESLTTLLGSGAIGGGLALTLYC